MFIVHIIQSEPRLDDDTRSGTGVNLHESTITVTPASTYNIYCYTPGYAKDWYKVEGTKSSTILRSAAPGYNTDIFAFNPDAATAEPGSLALHFASFKTADIGEYECRYTQRASPHVSTTLSIHLSECCML